MGIVSHFVMRRMVGSHMPEFATRTGIDPMTGALGTIDNPVSLAGIYLCPHSILLKLAIEETGKKLSASII